MAQTAPSATTAIKHTTCDTASYNRIEQMQQEILKALKDTTP